MRQIRRSAQPKQDDPELTRATTSAVGSPAAGLDLDIRLREFEINQLTQRNNFFMIFQGVLIGGVVQSGGAAAPLISFLVCLAGMGISLLQIGMAGGAKYWQVRWEAATRSSELALLMKLLKHGRDATRTFTHDVNALSPEEKKIVEEWNLANPPPADRVENWPTFVHEQVKLDVGTEGRSRVRYWLDWWVRHGAILPRWSVSRIPIWTGAVLLTFWSILWLHTFHVPKLSETLEWLTPSWVQLTPLKAERPTQIGHP